MFLAGDAPKAIHDRAFPRGFDRQTTAGGVTQATLRAVMMRWAGGFVSMHSEPLPGAGGWSGVTGRFLERAWWVRYLYTCLVGIRITLTRACYRRGALGGSNGFHKADYCSCYGCCWYLGIVTSGQRAAVA